MIAVSWALWCLAQPGFGESGTAQVIQVDRSEVVLNVGRRDGLALDAEVNLLRLGSPIVHPLTGQVLGRPQEPVGVARVFEVGEGQSRAVIEKSYSAPQVGDAVEYEPRAGREAAGSHRHEAAVQPAAGGHAQKETAPVEKAAGAAREEDHGKAGGMDGEVQQRLKDLERSVEEYHSSSKTLKAYPVFAQRVWDEISTMKSYLVSLDERLVQLEEQQSQDRHLTSVLSGNTAGGEEGMREFTIRYAPDTQVKLKVAGKTLLISVDHDSLRVEGEGMGEPAAEAGTPLAPQGEAAEGAAAHRAESEAAAGEHQGEPAGEKEEPHGTAEVHAAESEAAGQLPWYQSPWVLGTGVLTLGLVAGVVSWLIKRRYEEESEELEADYLEDEDEDEDEEED